MVHHCKHPLFSLLILTLGSWLHKMLHSTLHIVTYARVKFVVAMSNAIADAFTRKFYTDLDLCITLSIAQSPLHHWSYAPAKF